MRKLSKILTVLLTMTMLFSAMAIFSFADSAAQTNLLESPYATKVLNAENFESAKIGAYSPSLNSAAKGFNNTTAGTVTLAIEQQTNSEGATNKYLTFTHSKSDTQKYIDMTTGDKTGSYSDSIYSSSNYDYMVLDYDFTSMEYLYEIDGYTFHGKNPPENAENVRLAYWDKFKMTSSFRTDGTFSVSSIFILWDDATKEWYASADNSLNTDTDIKLSNKLGEWNHVTLVCKTGKNDGLTDTLVLFYINGQYISEGSVKNAKNFHADCVRIWFNTSDISGGIRDYYSVSFDNIASYYYKTGYTSGDDIYGIDDFLNQPDYKTKSITSAMDIVYNEDYYYTGTENTSSANIVYADNTTRAIPNVKKLVPFLKNNANVTLNVSLFDFDLPVSSGIETLTFKTSRPDLSVTLSAVTRENYKLYHNGNTYVLKLKDADDGMKIKWYKDVDNNEFFEEGYLLPYATPNLDKFKAYHVLDMEAGTLEVIEFWTVSIPGTKYNEVMPQDFYLTPAEICELKEIYGIDTVYLVPHYKTIDLKYVITTTETVEDEEVVTLYAPDCDFDKFGTAASLVKDAEKAPNNATLTLFKDLTLDLVNLEAKTLNLNLNGKTLTSSGSVMFSLNESATLNVFGGGKIIANIFANVADGVDECALNILGVKDGDNTIYIDFSVATLVKAVGPLTVIGEPFKDQTNSKKINVNIEGGKFAISSTLTDVAAPDVIVNIDNATIILENDNSAVFAEAAPVTGQTYYTAGYKVTVKNTAIVTKSDAHVFSIDSDWINVYFENTKVIAKTYDLTRATTVNITLGKDNVFAGDINAYEAKLKFSDGVEYEINSDDTNVLTVDEFSGVISLTTFVEEAEDDQTPPVNATASVENDNAESNVAKSTTPNSTYCLAEHIEKNKEKALPKSLSADSKENEEEK